MDNVVYNGEYSVTFMKSLSDRRNTWIDWGLVSSSRFPEPLNQIWSNKVTLGGISGEEDLVRMYPYGTINSYSNFRSAIVNDNRLYIMDNYEYDLYQPVSGQLSFTIADQETSFFKKQQDILAYLHNQEMDMFFSYAASEIYHVRTTVDSFTNGANFSSVSISYSIVRASDSSSVVSEMESEG